MIVELDLELVLLAAQAVPTTKLWDNGPGVGGEVGAAGCLVSSAFLVSRTATLASAARMARAAALTSASRWVLSVSRWSSSAMPTSPSASLTRIPRCSIPAARASSSLSVLACAAAASAAAVMWSR